MSSPAAQNAVNVAEIATAVDAIVIDTSVGADNAEAQKALMQQYNSLEPILGFPAKDRLDEALLHVLFDMQTKFRHARPVGNAERDSAEDRLNAYLALVRDEMRKAAERKDAEAEKERQWGRDEKEAALRAHKERTARASPEAVIVDSGATKSFPKDLHFKKKTRAEPEPMDVDSPIPSREAPSAPKNFKKKPPVRRTTLQNVGDLLKTISPSSQPPAVSTTAPISNAHTKGRGKMYSEAAMDGMKHPLDPKVPIRLSRKPLASQTPPIEAAQPERSGSKSKTSETRSDSSMLSSDVSYTHETTSSMSSEKSKSVVTFFAPRSEGIPCRLEARCLGCGKRHHHYQSCRW
ncbi:hypothetical protein MKEN_00208400 [Mycena kentingensis (nom. inval.)]|nr:hypothetical protein MKEN_00208400 [Mycena kentingensis (nom. inval.)]